MDETVITAAFDLAQQTRTELAEAWERKIVAETDVEQAKWVATNNGSMAGKNDLERNASFFSDPDHKALLEELYDRERELAVAVRNNDIAKLGVQRIQALISWTKGD
jgi:hypothetical protein